MTNNLKLINRLTELKKQTENIQNEILDIIILLEKEPIADNIIMENVYIGYDLKCINTINKFLRESGNILDKSLQNKLVGKLTWCNENHLSLIKLLRYLEYEFEYIETTKEWKDININIKDIKKF